MCWCCRAGPIYIERPLANHLSRSDHIATWVTRVLNPAVLGVLAILFLDGVPRDGLRARLWTCLYGPGCPTAVAILFRVLGRVDSVFMPDARLRILPLLAACVSSIVGVWHLGEMDGPLYLRMLLVAYAVVALLAAGSTYWWPFSLHVAGVVIPVGVGVVGISLWFIWMLPVCVVVGWARLRRREHTLAQVVVGGMVGAVALLLAVGEW